MDDLDPLYKEIILDLYRHPLNFGVVPDADAAAEDVNPSCGDQIKITVKFDRAGRIAAIAHAGHGCAISQAAVSLLTDKVKQKNKAEVAALTAENITDLLGIPISHTRIKCATLGLRVLQQAIT